MSKITDQVYLRDEQYKDASNLNARIELHRRFSTNPIGFHQWIFDHLDLPSNARILEIGCGPGMLWLMNLDRIPMGWDVTLTDLSPGMLEEARRNLEGRHPGFHFEVADAQSLPFMDASFDAVIANHMLYHVPDRARALSEMHRVMRLGGQFYASTVGQNHMRELNEIVNRFDPNLAIWNNSLAGTFLLENGAGQLAKWFCDVMLHRHEDALFVTEVAPLLAYIVSSAIGPPITGDRLERLKALIARELAEQGKIIITKEAGVFEAMKES